MVQDEELAAIELAYKEATAQAVDVCDKAVAQARIACYLALEQARKTYNEAREPHKHKEVKDGTR